MNEREWLVRRAEREFIRDGALSLTTVMDLSAAGLDVEALEEEFETNYALLEDEYGVETEDQEETEDV